MIERSGHRFGLYRLMGAMVRWLDGSMAQFTLSSFPSAAKKLAQYHGAILCHHSPDDLDPVIKPRVIKYLQQRTTCARFGIVCPEHDTSQPRLHDGAGAHRARLDCSIQSAVVQAVVAQLLGGPPQGKDFGVSCGIVEVDGPVVCARNDTPVLGDNRSHGNFIFVQAALSLAK